MYFIVNLLVFLVLLGVCFSVEFLRCYIYVCFYVFYFISRYVSACVCGLFGRGPIVVWKEVGRLAMKFIIIQILISIPLCSLLNYFDYLNQFTVLITVIVPFGVAKHVFGWSADTIQNRD